MNVGRLRHRIEIQSQTETMDDLGQRLDVWTEVATVWASIEDRRGREVVESREAIVNEVTTNIRIRYREDVFPEMRAIERCHAGRTFNITSVRIEPVRDGRAPQVMLECEEQRVEVEAA